MAEVNFKIDGSAVNATQLNASAREFKLIVDEPPTLGGNDNGANPVEYLLAGYAGCLNVVAHLTAKELGINLQHLKISVNGNIELDKFFGVPTNERAGFKSLNVDFEPVTDAPGELIAKWIDEIKLRCPINDNLSNPTPVNLNLVQPKFNLN